MTALADGYSDDFSRASAAEAERLRSQAAELRARAERYLALSERHAAAALELEQRVRELDELLGRAPQLRLDVPEREISGQALRDEAVKLLARAHGIDRPIHYRRWYELLVAEGVRVAGQDPVATFLTQISRSPLVERTSRAGVYRLNPVGAGERAADEVAQAEKIVARKEADLAAAGSAEERTAARAELSDARRRLAIARRGLADVARMQIVLGSLAGA